MEVFELHRSDLEKQKCLHAAFIRFPCSDMNLLTFYSCKGRAGRGTSQGQCPQDAVLGSERPVLGGDSAEGRGGQVVAWQGLCSAPLSLACPLLPDVSLGCHHPRSLQPHGPLQIPPPTPRPLPTVPALLPTPSQEAISPFCHFKFPWPRASGRLS